MDTDGIARNDLQMKMDGMDVFSFAISTVPKSLKAVYELSGKTDSDVDLYLLHQALAEKSTVLQKYEKFVSFV